MVQVLLPPSGYPGAHWAGRVKWSPEHVGQQDRSPAVNASQRRPSLRMLELQLSKMVFSETASEHTLYSGEQGLYMSLERWKGVFRLNVSHWLEFKVLRNASFA